MKASEPFHPRSVAREDACRPDAAQTSIEDRRAAISPGHIVTSPPPPADLLDGASLFLDFDGTLVDIAARPDDVVVDAGLCTLLAGLNARLGGRLAIVSGRSIAQLDALLGDVAGIVAVSGSHGVEHRRDGAVTRPTRPDALDRAADRLHAFAAGHDGVVVEEKSFGVALHYRLAPACEDEALVLARDVAAALELGLQKGKMMAEIRVPGADKGAAVRHFMDQPPMTGTRAVFVGDDLTDEHGFAAAVALGGAGVFVGPERDTAARYRLDDPHAVRGWLAEAAR